METSKKQQYILLIIDLLLFSLFLVACSPEQTTPNVTTDTTSSASTTVATKPTIAQPSTVTTAIPSIQSLPTVTLTSLGITPTANNRPTLPNNWQFRWLKGIPCHLPCWEGITLGITSVEEAVNILKQSPLVDPNSVGISETTDNHYAYWLWVNGTKSYEGAYFDPNSKSRVISRIAPDYSVAFGFSDIIKAFGEPDYVYATGMPGIDTPCCYYGVTFLYLRQGFALHSTNNVQRKPEINNLMPLRLVTFFAPTNDPTNLYPDSEYFKVILPWQGFKDFDFYCRNSSKINQRCPEPDK